MGTFKGPTITTISQSGNLAIVNASGQLAVDAVVNVGAVTTAISGQILYLTSGQNTIQLTSGLNLVTLVSGYNLVQISGQPVSVSGGVVKVSGETIRLISGHNSVFLYAYDKSGLVWNPVAVETSGGNKLSVDTTVNVGSVTAGVSGETLYLISGQNTVQLTSGFNFVVISGTPIAKISGETVRLTSGFNQVQLVSGTNLTREAEPFNVFTAITLLITGASGGLPLLSGECSRVTVRNIGDSGTVMYVGHSGQPPWVASGQSWPMYSGFGFWLRDGDAVTMPVQNRNTDRIKVVSHISGARVSYVGSAF